MNYQLYLINKLRAKKEQNKHNSTPRQIRKETFTIDWCIKHIEYSSNLDELKDTLHRAMEDKNYRINIPGYMNLSDTTILKILSMIHSYETGAYLWN